MKTHLPLAVLALLALPALAAPSAGAAEVVTVTLEVGQGHHILPASVSCQVAVPAFASAAAVLDAAVAEGCIGSWEAADFGTPENPDRYVTCIDGTCETTGLAWAFYVNHALAPWGIDGYAAGDGETVSFTYSTWASFFLP